MNFSLYTDTIKNCYTLFLKLKPSSNTSDLKESLLSILPLQHQVNQQLESLLPGKQLEFSKLSQHFTVQIAQDPINTILLFHTLDHYQIEVLKHLHEALMTGLLQKPHLEIGIAEDIWTFYDTSLYSPYEKSLVFFLTARLLSHEAPLQSYTMTLKAFEIFPALSEHFNPPIHYTYSPKEEVLLTTCPICGSVALTPYFSAPIFNAINFTPSFSPVKLWCKCDKCHTLLAHNFPLILTSDETYELTKTNFLGQHYMLPRVPLILFANLISRLQHYSSGKHYLEVGVGTGEFIAVALELGIEVDAIELMPTLCEQLEQVLDFSVTCCDFLLYTTSKTYDVITMGDVIEHMNSPRQALLKAYELLNPNGIIWVSTPNYQSSYTRLLKFSDPMWLEPWHRTYFCYESFSLLLESCGFQILEYKVSERYNGSMEIIARKVT